MLSNEVKERRLAHVSKQVESREIDLDVEFLVYLAEKTTEEDVAIVLGTKEYLGSPNVVILIVREKFPTTIEYRRKSQSLDKKHLRVENILYESFSL